MADFVAVSAANRRGVVGLSVDRHTCTLDAAFMLLGLEIFNNERGRLVKKSPK